MIGACEKAYPGVPVKLITANSKELTERLFLEAQAGQITVDVTDPGRDNRVVEADLAEDLTDIIEELGVDTTEHIQNCIDAIRTEGELVGL